MKWKKAWALLASACLVLTLGACSRNGNGQPGGEGGVTITWWAFPVFGQEDPGDPVGTYEKKAAAAFHDKYPHITVQVETIDFTSGPQQLVTAMEGGSAPDVLLDAPGRVIEYGKAGRLVPLDDLFTEEFARDVDNQALLDACKGDGAAYLYPISSAPFYMAINRQMWEQAGALEHVNLEGDRTWTTADFEQALAKLAAAGYTPGTVYCNGQGGDQGTRALISNLYGGAVADRDRTQYTFNSEASVRALTAVKQWMDQGYLGKGVSNTAAGDIELFSTGVSAFTFCWGTSTALAQQPNLEAAGVEPISLPFPAEGGTPALEYLVNGFCVFDNQDPARAEAAKLLIQFLCDDPEWGPRNVVRTGAFPVRTSFGDLYAGSPLAQEYAVLAQWTGYYAPYYNTMDGFAVMRTQWWNMLQKITMGDETPEAAANAAVEASNRAMAG